MPNVCTTLTCLGTAYSRLGNAEKKHAMLDRAKAIKDRGGATSAEDDAAFEDACQDLDAAAKRCEALDAALADEEARYGATHRQVGSTLVQLAAAHSVLGEHAKERHCLERALVIFEESYGPSHVEVAYTLGDLEVDEQVG